MSFTSTDVKLLQRSRVAGAVVGVLWFAFGVGVVASALDRTFALLFQGIGQLLAYAIAAALGVWRLRPPKPVDGVLEAGEAGITLNGRLLCAREGIREGFVVPADASTPEVRIDRQFPRSPLRFRVPDETKGRELLAALGLDAAQALATFKLASLARAWGGTGANLAAIAALPAIAVVLGMTSGAPWGLAVAGLLALGVVAWVVANLIPGHARVGADGVLVEWLWRRKFVDFESFRAARMFVEGSNAGVTVELTDGEEVKLHAMGLFTASIERDDLTMMAARIAQAADVHRRAQADRGVRLPQRGERSAGEWLKLLRALGSGANADHRTAPVAPDTLFRIAEDPGTEPVRRIAAAVALSGGLDEAGRSRLRIAASTTAAPELREVLELAAEESATEEALAAAIERVQAVRD